MTVRPPFFTASLRRPRSWAVSLHGPDRTRVHCIQVNCVKIMLRIQISASQGHMFTIKEENRSPKGHWPLHPITARAQEQRNGGFDPSPHEQCALLHRGSPARASSGITGLSWQASPALLRLLPSSPEEASGKQQPSLVPEQTANNNPQHEHRD